MQSNCFIRIETYSKTKTYDIPCYLLYLILSLTLLFFFYSCFILFPGRILRVLGGNFSHRRSHFELNPDGGKVPIIPISYDLGVVFFSLLLVVFHFVYCVFIFTV